jgi:hypothetical protein
MRYSVAIVLCLVVTGAPLAAFDSITWETTARLILANNEFYSLEANDAGEYRLSSAMPEITRLLGKGVEREGRITFSAPGQRFIVLFRDAGSPELNRLSSSRERLSFVSGATYNPAAAAGHAIAPLHPRTARIIAGSPDDNRVLLEEVEEGSSFPPFVYPTHFLYIVTTGDVYRRFSVTRVSRAGTIVFFAQNGNDETTLTIDWNEQGKAVGKLVLPDKTVRLLDCGYFNAAADEPEERE